MKKFVHASRWFLGIVVSLVLLIVVSVGLVLIPISLNLSSSDKLLEWINDSGIYTSATDIVFEELSKEAAQSQDLADLPLPEDALKKVIGDALTPSFLEESTNSMVRGVYLWLNGETAVPQFEISLTEREGQITLALNQALKEKLNGLKECPTKYMPSSGSDFNPFEAECLPQGIDIESEITKITGEFLTQADFISKAQISGDSLPISQDILINGPIAFKWFKLVPFIICGLVVLLAGMIALLIPGTRSDFAVISFPLGIVGLIGVVMYIEKSLLSRQLKMTLPLDSIAESSIQINNVIERLLNSVTNDVFQVMLVISLSLIGVASTMILTQVFLNRRNSS